MKKYLLKEFIRDCISLGWYKSKAVPAWMESLDVDVERKDLEKVLCYKEGERAIPVIMDYGIGKKGRISFSMARLSNGIGVGFVANKEDLFIYMKVAGFKKLAMK